MNTMMVYYKQMVRHEMLTVKHAMIALTNDFKKDANSVKAFEDKAVETRHDCNGVGPKKVVGR